MYEDILIHVRHKLLVRINSRDILLIEADSYYSKVITSTGSYLVNATLAQIEESLPAHLFCRVHRSYIIPISGIINIENDVINLHDRHIPLTKQYRENLLSRMKIIR